MDKQRASYYNFYTNQKYGDMENYDLCLDGSFFGIDSCVEIISSIYDLKNIKEKRMKIDKSTKKENA